MQITLFAYRKPNQHAVVIVSTWAVGRGTRELLRLDWDPTGPMRERDAVLEVLERALTALSPRGSDPGAEAPAPAWEDVPLPGLAGEATESR